MEKICPICHKKLKVDKNAALADSNHLPFCSTRCKLIDLGAWFDGDYVVPKKPEDDEDMEPG